MVPQIYDYATELHQAGIKIFPVGSWARSNGDRVHKAPMVPKGTSWIDVANNATAADIQRWWGGQNPQHTGIGMVCGDDSGHIEMVEIEGPYADRLERLEELAKQAGPETHVAWLMIKRGWTEKSPSGGYHFFYRVRTDGATPDNKGRMVGGNTKLAQTVVGELPNGKPKITEIAETRGTGGYVIVAPSYGDVHETGKPYERLYGGPSTIWTISMEQREAIHDLFRGLNEHHKPSTVDRRATNEAKRSNGDKTPWDDFNERGPSWAELLESEGWELFEGSGDDDDYNQWTKPGASSAKISAATNYEDNGLLKVFSTSTEFDTDSAYSKYAAYAVLNHGGDFSEAAKALMKQGYGTQQKRHLTAVPSAQVAPTNDPGGFLQATGTDNTVVNLAAHRNPVVQDANRIAISQTDDGNARLFAELFHEQVRFDTVRDLWMVWDGKRWEHQPKNAGATIELAKQASHSLPEFYSDPDGALNKEESKKALSWKRKSLSKNGLESTIWAASTIPGMAVDASELDSHPFELNTPDGIVDLTTGEMSPHDITKMHTKITGASPDFSADRSFWERFLEVSVPDDDTRCYLKRAAGMSLIGRTLEEILFFIWGEGKRGKTVFVESVRAALGEYAGKAPSDFLVSKRSDEHPASIMLLKGVRMSVSSEVSDAARLNEQRIKELTGNEELTARYMHQNYETFQPTHTLWLVGNDRPSFNGADYAMIRRLKVIPFNAQIRPEDQVPDLKNKILDDHLPAVMAWAIEGCMEYLEHGLGPTPLPIAQALDNYSKENDSVRTFVDEECVLHASHVISIKEFFEKYEQWCLDHGMRPLGKNRIYQRLEKMGVGRQRTRNGRFYTGIKHDPQYFDRSDTMNHYWPDTSPG